MIRALRGDPISPGAAPWSLLEAIVKRGKTPAARLQAAYQLHSYAWQAGLLGAQDLIEPTPEPEPEGPAARVPGLRQLNQ